MSRDWEETFRVWTKPSSDTEEAKCQTSVSMIRDAINNSATLKPLDAQVFAHGSYKNNTNVRNDSDVDVIVRCMKYCYTEYQFSNGLDNAAVGLETTSYTSLDFKNDVEEALVTHFGRSQVERGNKAIIVQETSSRIVTDVVACFELRRYYRGNTILVPYWYESGIQFWSDKSDIISNWPEYHYDNGVQKNTVTGKRFKYITRVLKRLRNEMEAEGVSAAKPMSSFLIECLVWNIPDDHFSHDAYWAIVRDVLAYTFNNTRTAEACNDWGEVSERKYLLRGQDQLRSGANRFLGAAWNYIGYE